MPDDKPPRLQVAAAAIFNADGEVLISRRAEHVHQGNRWEFPGGKLEPGEDARAALTRELREELGIAIESARPLIRIAHDYPDLAVLLDVWRIDRFTGSARGCEGQAIAWVKPQDLSEYAFPAANHAIIAAVQLPDRYLITPEGAARTSDFLSKVEQAIVQGIRLIQFRDKTLGPDRYREVAESLLNMCETHQVKLLLNADPEVVRTLGVHGVHLSSARLMACRERPLPAQFLVAASCHNADELRQAARTGVDFAVLGPVQFTATHSATSPLGWPRFAELCERAPFPVYALGGLQYQDLAMAFASGAQGVAGIRGLWPNEF